MCACPPPQPLPASPSPHTTPYTTPPSPSFPPPLPPPGYKIINVARCWANETGVALGADLPEDLPPNEYYPYYAPVGHRLTVAPRPRMEDANTREDLDRLRTAVLQHLQQVAAAPGVGFHARPPDAMDLDAHREVRGVVEGRWY